MTMVLTLGEWEHLLKVDLSLKETHPKGMRLLACQQIETVKVFLENSIKN